MPKAEGSIFDVQVLLDADDEPDALDAESKRVDFTKAFTSNGEGRLGQIGYGTKYQQATQAPKQDHSMSTHDYMSFRDREPITDLAPHTHTHGHTHGHTEADTQTQTQTQKQTDRQTDRHTHRHTDTHRHKHRHRHRHKHRHRHITHTNTHTIIPHPTPQLMYAKIKKHSTYNQASDQHDTVAMTVAIRQSTPSPRMPLPTNAFVGPVLQSSGGLQHIGRCACCMCELKFLLCSTSRHPKVGLKPLSASKTRVWI